MSPDEFDKYLQGEPDEMNDDLRVITPEHVSIVLSATQDMFKAAMGELNQISVTLTKVQPDGGYMWSATVHGVTVVYDSLEEFIEAVARLA